MSCGCRYGCADEVDGRCAAYWHGIYTTAIDYYESKLRPLEEMEKRLLPD